MNILKEGPVNEGFMKSAVVARRERLKKIYERVLYRGGDDNAQDLYQLYFKEQAGEVDVKKLQREIDLKRVTGKHIQVNNIIDTPTHSPPTERSKSVGKKHLQVKLEIRESSHSSMNLQGVPKLKLSSGQIV